MFKKLFEIDYNNKRFLILVDNNHRKTFLEVIDGKYVYPEYEDYKYLNEVYNNYDYTVKYSKGMSYKEKVRYKSALLVASVVLSLEVGYIGKLVIDMNSVEKKELSIQFQRMYKDESSNRNNINMYYDDVITRSDVINAINNNRNLDDYYKKMAIEVLDLCLELDPNINLRIYYENIKDLKVVISSFDDISNGNTKNQVGYFSSLVREIHLSDTVAKNDMAVTHELLHAVHNIIDSSREDILFINETRGFSLEEAMTQRMVSHKYGYDYAYDIEQRILNYFIGNLDNFDYHIYNEKGITGVIDEIKHQYPEVDVDYLVDYIDTYTQSNNVFSEIKIQPYEDIDFCDELFKMAINNIDKDDIYASFNRFMGIFSGFTNEEYYNRYSQLYYDELVKLKESSVSRR